MEEAEQTPNLSPAPVAPTPGELWAQYHQDYLERERQRAAAADHAARVRKRGDQT